MDWIIVGMAAASPIVTVKNGSVVANSKDVAAYFGKTHKRILEDIDHLISSEPSIEPNFGPIEIEVKVGFGIRKDRAFDMTRDGFTLLAIIFKAAYRLRALRPVTARRKESTIAMISRRLSRWRHTSLKNWIGARLHPQIPM